MKIKNSYTNDIIACLILISSTANAEEQLLGNSVLDNVYNHQIIDYGQVVYGTLIVIIILGLVVFLVKKTRLHNFGKYGLVEVISSLAITTKDKLLVIRVGKEYLLIGVSNGGVNKIHTLDKNDIESLAKPGKTNAHSFANIYSSTIGRLNNA